MNGSSLQLWQREQLVGVFEALTRQPVDWYALHALKVFDNYLPSRAVTVYPGYCAVVAVRPVDVITLCKKLIFILY